VWLASNAQGECYVQLLHPSVRSASLSGPRAPSTTCELFEPAVVRCPIRCSRARRFAPYPESLDHVPSDRRANVSSDTLLGDLQELLLDTPLYSRHVLELGEVREHLAKTGLPGAADAEVLVTTAAGASGAARIDSDGGVLGRHLGSQISTNGDANSYIAARSPSGGPYRPPSLNSERSKWIFAFTASGGAGGNCTGTCANAD
jgi:hypothetical protein